jgi:hypothetical protein
MPAVPTQPDSADSNGGAFGAFGCSSRGISSSLFNAVDFQKQPSNCVRTGAVVSVAPDVVQSGVVPWMALRVHFQSHGSVYGD